MSGSAEEIEMTSKVERQARALLWLFPRWMRAERGEEAVGLVVDLVPATAERLPLRSRLDLVRAGLQARRRGTPPWRVWSRVATASQQRVDAGVPAAWRPWLMDALAGRSLLWVCAVVQGLRMIPFLLYPLLLGFGATPWQQRDPMLILWIVVIIGGSVGAWVTFRRHRWRTRLAAANGMTPDGRPLPPHEVEPCWTRASVPNGWVTAVLASAALVGGGYGPVAWASAADAPDHPDAQLSSSVLAAVVALTLLLAAWTIAGAWRRLGAIDRTSPTSPTVIRPVHLRPWINTIAAIVAGGGSGILWAWAVSMLSLSIGLPMAGIWSGPLVAAVVAGLCGRAERRSRRLVGAWDLLPAWGPQVVVRAPSAADGAAPPPGPPTPLAG